MNVTGYAGIIRNNLDRLIQGGAFPQGLSACLPADVRDGSVVFTAFGERCRIDESGIFLGEDRQTGPVGILISLYALYASSDAMLLEPFQSFKELPDSMPYAGAFKARTEIALTPYVDRIETATACLCTRIGGNAGNASVGGDFSFVLHPLPKIALCYIFYREDDEFPASATCLYSHNAQRFLPTDALADVGEYTSKKIISLIDASPI